jgi:hypothetical protein
MLKMYLGVGKNGGVSWSPADSILVAPFVPAGFDVVVMAFVRPLLLLMWKDLLWECIIHDNRRLFRTVLLLLVPPKASIRNT